MSGRRRRRLAPHENEDPVTVSRGTMDAELMAYLRRALEALPHTG